MPKVIVSVDGVVIKEVELTKARTSLGRRPYNDIVIDNLAVSGEHAVFEMNGSEVQVEDLHSTNGSYVNGKAVTKQLLQNGDVVEVGKYKIKFVADTDAGSFDQTMMIQTGSAGPALAARIKVSSGAAAGRELLLTKDVTTIGKPGVAVVTISRQADRFVLRHADGEGQPLLNGASIGADQVALKNGDLIELAGTQMQFIQVG